MEELAQDTRRLCLKREIHQTPPPLPWNPPPPHVWSQASIHIQSIHLEVCSSQSSTETRWHRMETLFLRANDFVHQERKPSEQAVS